MSTTEKSLDSLSDSYTTARISDLEDSNAGSVPIYGIYDSEMTIFLETVIDGDEVYLSIDKSVTKSEFYESQVYHLYDVTSDVDGSFKRSIDVQMDLEKRAVKFGSMDEYAVSITNYIPDSLVKCDSFSEVFPEEFQLFNSYLSSDNRLKDGWKCEIVDVIPSGGEQFIVQVLAEEYEIEFEYSVPEDVDIESDDASRLVELVGQGELKFLRDEYVYVVHESDVPEGLRTVGVDLTGEWSLITPDDFEEYNHIREQIILTSKTKVRMGKDGLKVLGGVIGFVVSAFLSGMTSRTLRTFLPLILFDFQFRLLRYLSSRTDNGAYTEVVSIIEPFYGIIMGLMLAIALLHVVAEANQVNRY